MNNDKETLLNEPIRHHYIPQFILRNFTVDNKINYWNKSTKKIELRNTKSIFMVRDLYTDEKNHPENIRIIEKKFSKLEDEISKLIKDFILDKNEIRITRDQNEKLRKFLFLLSFRSEYRKQQYIDGNFDELTKKSLAPYVKDNDYVDLWLREINAILNAHSYKDIENNEEISKIIRQDVQTELMGFYMTFLDTRGQDLLLTDVYPTAEVCPITPDFKANIHLHAFFPLTPTRLLVLNHIMFKPENRNNELRPLVNFSRIKGNILESPKPIYKKQGFHSDDDIYVYKVQKIYEKDVQYINHLYLNESKTGIAFYNKDRITSSVASYEELPNEYRRQSFEELNNYLSKVYAQ